jgi:transposase-like protein
MTTHRTWSSEEKFRIVLEGISPKANVAEICRSHGISSSQFYKWRERALVSMKTGLKSGEGTVEQGLRQQNARLKRLVADQALALQVFREDLEGGAEGKNGGGGLP